MEYQVCLSKESDDSYVAYCPRCPGLSAKAPDADSAVKRLQSVIRAATPQESSFQNKITIRIISDDSDIPAYI